MLKRASEDPLPSQILDDSQPPPVFPNGESEIFHPEQYVERVLRAEKLRRGRGWVRRVLVKWKGFAEPTWEDRSALEETMAMDEFEAIYGKSDGVGEQEGSRLGINLEKKRTKKKGSG